MVWRAYSLTAVAVHWHGFQWEASDLGRAVYRAGIEPRMAPFIHDNLRGFMKETVLTTSLHLLFLIVDPDVAMQVSVCTCVIPCKGQP